MEQFVAHQLHFNCEAITAISLPHYNGAILRGAFFSALRQDFCLNKRLNSCLHCPTAEVCPICRLVATVEHSSNRGAEIPRPFALQPIITEKTILKPCESFSFGITLFGQSLSLFPYVILAVQRMGETGMGNRKIASGRFLLKGASVLNPLTSSEKSVYSTDTHIVNSPDIAVTSQDVVNYAAGFNGHALTLQLITPLRLVVKGSLVQKLTFPIFIQRLLRRLTDLYRHCCNQELVLDFPSLLQKAESVLVTQDSTCWVDLSSYSNRRHTSTPIGGLTGNITFTGNMKEFMPLLIWGELTHLGKDTTKGNGWYRIADSLS